MNFRHRSPMQRAEASSASGSISPATSMGALPCPRALARARAEEAEISRRELTTQTRLAAAVDFLEKIGADLAETRIQAEEVEGDLAALPEAKSARAALDEARTAAAAARRRDADARA